MMNTDNILPEIEVSQLSYRYSNHPTDILSNINLAIPKGSFTGILGPNGSGKTTLLKCLTKVLPATSGRIILAGQNLAGLSAREIARIVGVVPQKWDAAFPFTVGELVIMGRFPHQKKFHYETADDYQIADEAMSLTQTLHLKHRPVTRLSGGELQRVIIAQALAQSPRILLLDEPTAALDIHHQLEIFEVIESLRKNRALTVVAVMHDLNLASHYCQQLVFLRNGSIFASGAPETVLTETNLKQVYGTKARVSIDPLTAKPFVRIYPATSITPITETNLKIHLIGGGGSITELLEILRFHGFQLSCGVINIMDSDWLAAKELEISMVEVAPFSPITPEAQQMNLGFIANADVVVLGNIPFGSGNRENLQAALSALENGKQVVVCDFTPILERDFTGGWAAEVYAKLNNKGAILVDNNQKLLEKLKHILFLQDSAGPCPWKNHGTA
jgi:iron complex transport system ATP-binding protein